MKAAETRNAEVCLLRSIRLEAPEAGAGTGTGTDAAVAIAAYVVTWNVGDDVVAACVEVERAVTAVVVLKAQTQD